MAAISRGPSNDFTTFILYLRVCASHIHPSIVTVLIIVGILSYVLLLPQVTKAVGKPSDGIYYLKLSCLGGRTTTSVVVNKQFRFTQKSPTFALLRKTVRSLRSLGAWRWCLILNHLKKILFHIALLVALREIRIGK